MTKLIIPKHAVDLDHGSVCCKSFSRQVYPFFRIKFLNNMASRKTVVERTVR